MSAPTVARSRAKISSANSKYSRKEGVLYEWIGVKSTTRISSLISAMRRPSRSARSAPKNSITASSSSRDGVSSTGRMVFFGVKSLMENSHACLASSSVRSSSAGPGSAIRMSRITMMPSEPYARPVITSSMAWSTRLALISTRDFGA